MWLINFPIQRTSTRRYYNTCCTDILKYAYVKLFINTYMIDSKIRVLITTILKDKQDKQDVNYNCCCDKRSRDHNSHLSKNVYRADIFQCHYHQVYNSDKIRITITNSKYLGSLEHWILSKDEQKVYLSSTQFYVNVNPLLWLQCL